MALNREKPSPNPAQIAARAKRIRSRWTAKTRESRWVVPSEPPVVVTVDKFDAATPIIGKCSHQPPNNAAALLFVVHEVGGNVRNVLARQLLGLRSHDRVATAIGAVGARW